MYTYILYTICSSTTDQPISLPPLLHTLTTHLTSEPVISRITSLQWLYMLHEKNSIELNLYIYDIILPYLFILISDVSDEVVILNLHVIARFSMDSKVRIYIIYTSMNVYICIC